MSDIAKVVVAELMAEENKPDTSHDSDDLEELDQDCASSSAMMGRWNQGEASDRPSAAAAEGNAMSDIEEDVNEGTVFISHSEVQL